MRSWSSTERLLLTAALLGALACAREGAGPAEPTLPVSAPAPVSAPLPLPRLDVARLASASCAARELARVAPGAPTSPAFVERLGAWLDTRGVDLDGLAQDAAALREHPGHEAALQRALHACGGPEGLRADDLALLEALRLRRQPLPAALPALSADQSRYVELAAGLLCLASASPPPPDLLARRAALLRAHHLTEPDLLAAHERFGPDPAVAAHLAAPRACPP